MTHIGTLQGAAPVCVLELLPLAGTLKHDTSSLSSLSVFFFLFFFFYFQNVITRRQIAATHKNRKEHSS